MNGVGRYYLGLLLMFVAIFMGLVVVLVLVSRLLAWL